jgi:hypothetical protein
MTPNQVLREILEKRNLPTPTGKAIYSYKITKDEYDALKSALRVFKKPEQYPKAFFLYASEWCRREYNEGHRNYEDIFESINLNNKDWNHGKVRSIIEKGAECWDLDILQSQSGNNSFISTLIYNGGLPISALNSGSQTAIRQLIVSASLDLINGLPLTATEAISKRNIGLRGAIFQQNEYLELIASFTESILEVRKEMRLRDIGLDTIDYHLPRWKEEFPIHIESSEELKFLQDILEDIEKEERKSQADTIKLNCYLLERDGGINQSFRLKGEILVNRGRSPLNYFLPDSQLTLNEFPNSFNLEFSDADSNILSAKRLSTITDECVVKINILTGERFYFSEEKLKNGIYIGFADSSGSFHTDNRFECFEPIEPSQSMIFIEKDGKWILHSKASCRVPNKPYRILIPMGMELDPSPQIRFIGKVDEWNIFEVTGNIYYTLEGEKYSIRVGDGNILSDNYILQFTYNSLISNYNTNVSIGMPLIRVRVNNIPTHLPPHNIRISGHKLSSNNVHELLFGKKKLQILDPDGCIAYQRTLTFLPESFSVSLNHGAITFNNLSGYEVSQITDEGKQKFDVVDSVIPTNTIPPKRCLEFALSFNGKEARFKLPAPLYQFDFFGVDFKKIPNGSILGIDQISSVRLYGRTAVNFITLEFKLLNKNVEHIEKIPLDSNRTPELPLTRFRGKIESLLALANIYGQVRITIIESGCIIVINRFGNNPLLSKIGNQQFELKKTPLLIKIFDLRNPALNQDLKEVALNFNKGVFDMSPEMIGTDKAILLPTRPGRYESLAFRPILYIQHGEIETEIQEDRIQRLKEEYDLASTDFSESSKFNQLPGLFRNTSHIPMQCLDDWTAITRCKKALVRLHLEAAFNSSDFGIILDELKKQYLLEYSWLPKSKWVEAIDAFFIQFQPNSVEQLKQRILSYLAENPELCRLDLILQEIFYQDIDMEAVAENIRNLPESLSKIINAAGQWPNDPDLHTSILADFSRLPDELKNHFLIIQENGRLRNIHNHQKPVIMLPVVLGFLSVERLENSELINLLYSPQFKFKLSEIIDFNPNYYRTAFQFARNLTFLQNQ